MKYNSFILCTCLAVLIVTPAWAQTSANQPGGDNQPASASAADASTSGQTSNTNADGQTFSGRVLAVETDRLTLQDMSTGATTTFTVIDSAILNDVNTGDEVQVQTDSNDPQSATDVQKTN